MEAFEAGAWDYIAKPFDLNTAIEKINKAISEKKNVQKKLSEKEEISLRAGKILGKSPAMQDLFNSIGKLSHSDSTVLLVGESGTGKELVSQAIEQMPDLALAYARKGSIYYKLGDIQRATVNWNIALKLDPEYNEVRSVLLAIKNNEQIILPE